MRQYPIYNRVIGQGKQGSANFGSHTGFTQHVLVGSSSANSHELATIRVSHDVDPNGSHIFTLYVDGVVIKQGVYEPTTGEYYAKTA